MGSYCGEGDSYSHIQGERGEGGGRGERLVRRERGERGKEEGREREDSLRDTSIYNGQWEITIRDSCPNFEGFSDKPYLMPYPQML